MPTNPTPPPPSALDAALERVVELGDAMLLHGGYFEEHRRSAANLDHRQLLADRRADRERIRVLEEAIEEALNWASESSVNEILNAAIRPPTPPQEPGT